MKSNIEKIQANGNLAKLLQFSEISKALTSENVLLKKTFSQTLKISEILATANENWNTAEVKDLLTKINISYKTKYDYFLDLTGYGKTYVSELLKIRKCPSEILTKFLETEPSPSVKKLIKLMDGKSEENVNTTAEKPTEKSETEKPAKFTTEKKGIDIKINSGVTKADITEAIKFLKGLKIK